MKNSIQLKIPAVARDAKAYRHAGLNRPDQPTFQGKPIGTKVGHPTKGKGSMKLTIQRRRRRTSIRLEIGDLVLTVEFPIKTGTFCNFALENSK